MLIKPRKKQFDGFVLDRWHSAIKIQAAIRRKLAWRLLEAMRCKRCEELTSIHRLADRREAAIKIQRCVRQFLARKGSRTMKQAVLRVVEARREELSRPELFSIHELPASMFQFDQKISNERRFTYSGTSEFPLASSTTFLNACKVLFDAIDVQRRGHVVERYLVELHEKLAPPVPWAIEGSDILHNDSKREAYCRSMIKRILSDSGRITQFVRHGGKDALRGAMSLNFDEFCTFLSVITQQ